MKIAKFNEELSHAEKLKIQREYNTKISKLPSFKKLNKLSNEYYKIQDILLDFLYFENILDENKRDYFIDNYYIGTNDKTHYSYSSITIMLSDPDDPKYNDHIELEQENVIKFIQFYDNQEMYKSANKYNL